MHRSRSGQSLTSIVFLGIALVAANNNTCCAQGPIPPGGSNTIYTQVSTLPVGPGITVIPIYLKLDGLPSTSVVDVNFWKVVAVDPITGAITRANVCSATVPLGATLVENYPGYPQFGFHFDGFTAYTSLTHGSGPYVVSFTNSGAEVAVRLLSP